jgi:hypothetical protein
MSRRFVPQSTITRRMDAKDARIARAFLAPESFPYTSVTLVRADGTQAELLARATDSTPPDCPTCDGYAFAGHVCPATVAPPRVICAWCPDFTPTPGGQSHGMCADCAAEFGADQDVEPGSRCGAACGHCGRCS